jgi:hypothetical protein
LRLYINSESRFLITDFSRGGGSLTGVIYYGISSSSTISGFYCILTDYLASMSGFLTMALLLDILLYGTVVVYISSII